ncbi:MAG TPA: hypothetical protein VGL71_00925 [Urbifossiella sp.]|jgi:hypothetical protein
MIFWLPSGDRLGTIPGFWRNSFSRGTPMNFRRHEESLAGRYRRLTPLLAVLLFLGLGAPAQAHPESLSNLRLVLGTKDLRATLTLPLRDLTAWFPPGRYHNYISDVVAELQKTGDSLIEVSWDDSAALSPLSVNVHPGSTGFIVAEMRYAATAGANTLVVRSAQMPNMPDAHQQVAWLEDERSGVANSRVVAEQVLTVQDDTLTVELPDKPPTTQPATVIAASSAQFSSAGELPPARRAESPLASSRAVPRAICILLIVMPACALLVVLVMRRRRSLVARNPSQSSNWITSLCGRSN